MHAIKSPKTAAFVSIVSRWGLCYLTERFVPSLFFESIG